MKNKIRITITVLFCIIPVSFPQLNIAKAEMLETWKDERAYRPNPILFLHGFGPGSPETWRGDEGHEPLDDKFYPFLSKYYAQKVEEHAITKKRAVLESTAYTYLEVLSFIDFSQNLSSQFIDRNRLHRYVPRWRLLCRTWI